MYIITAWDKDGESFVRTPNAVEAVRYAREFVSQGKRISIVRTEDGATLAFTELEAEADAQRG